MEKENILVLISSLIFYLSEPEEKDTVKLSQGNGLLWFFLWDIESHVFPKYLTVNWDIWSKWTLDGQVEL